MKKRVRPTSEFVQFKKRYVYNLGRRRRPQDRKKNHYLGRKGENEGDYNSLDRISLLPDELLVGILSLLPLKEATSTSILSRRWRYVWASTMNLVFDSGFNANPSLRLHTFSPEQRKKQARSYVDWVNSVMDQHEGTNIIRFRACFTLDDIFTSSIDEWIEFAMNKRVEILELDFFSTRSQMENYYSFPEKLLGLGQVYTSKLEHSHPENPSGYSIGFESLKVLSLCKVSVTQEMLEYLISNCPVLERLSVGYATDNLVDLRVVGPRIALKYLAIESCLELKSIEVRDVNLVSFYYRGASINLAVNNVPSLVDISMSVCLVNRAYRPRLTGPLTLPFDTLSCCLSQLEILELETNGAVYCENLYFQNRTFPTLTSLRQLKLVFVPQHYRSLCWLASSMKACPYLERLVLKQRPRWEIAGWRYAGEGEKLDIPDKCPSQNNYLKVVEIIGYRHHPCVTQYVKFLIENMVGLEKIIVDPVFHHWSWDGAIFRHDFPIEEAQAREHAMQHLKEIVPLTVEFACL